MTHCAHISHGWRGLRQDRAFTLLEVLLVAAVIALLAGMLLPSLAAAHKQGKRMRCVTHLRATGDALTLVKTATGSYPHTSGPPRFAGLANIGSIAKLLVRESLGNPQPLYCPASVEREPSYGPYKKVPGTDRVINQWETGQISYLYLPGVIDAFNDAAGWPTFDSSRESPDIRRNQRAVLVGDRTVEFAPGKGNLPSSNHGRDGGWFYFTSGAVDWWNWERLTAHPTHVYIWYWPRAWSPVLASAGSSHAD